MQYLTHHFKIPSLTTIHSTYHLVVLVQVEQGLRRTLNHHFKQSKLMQVHLSGIYILASPMLKNFQCVQDAINTVVTAKARREITQVLRTLTTMYTHYPSSEQYITVCRNLVTKYPKLRDDKENPFVRNYTYCMHYL